MPGKRVKQGKRFKHAQSIEHGESFMLTKFQKNRMMGSWPIIKISILDFFSEFQKIAVIRSSVCRTILIRNALESPDSGASNGGSNFILRHFGADMGAFKVAGWPRISADFEILDHPAILKTAMSAPTCRIWFEPPLDASRSRFSSELRIRGVRHTTTVRWQVFCEFWAKTATWTPVYFDF